MPRETGRTENEMLTTTDERFLRNLQKRITKGENALTALYEERDQAIVKMRQGGATLDAIGQPLGITRVRVRAIVEQRTAVPA